MTSSIHERFWRQCLLVAALSLLPIVACLILVLSLVKCYRDGVQVLENGQGSVIDCRIFNNQLGIEVQADSSLQVDSTGNARGAWNIAPGARVVRERNTK